MPKPNNTRWWLSNLWLINIINDALQKFLNVHNPILARSEYKKLISPKHLQDYEIAYKNIHKLEAKEILYSLQIKDQEYLVK